MAVHSSALQRAFVLHPNLHTFTWLGPWVHSGWCLLDYLVGLGWSGGPDSFY